MGQVKFGATPIGEKWIPTISIDDDDGEGATFILDKGFATRDEAGEFVKWFYSLVSNKEKQKKFIFSKDGMSSQKMKKALDRD